MKKLSVLRYCIIVVVYFCLGAVFMVMAQVDQTFTIGSGPNGVINTIAVQPNGQILVGGDFTTWNGTPVNRLVRLNEDGSIDQVFRTNIGQAAEGSGGLGQVYALLVQSDGRIIVGGNFTVFNSTSASMIVRLNANGTLDNSFTRTEANPAGGEITSLAVQSDGKIIVGGFYSVIQGVRRTNIARLQTDGVLDATFAGGGVDNRINAVVVQPDNRILVGGAFRSFNNVRYPNFVRLLPDGSTDVAFMQGQGSGVQGGNLEGVYAIALQANGQIVIGGVFSGIDTLSINRVARINNNGTIDHAFRQNIGTGGTQRVRSLLVLPNQRIMVGGTLTSFNGTPIGRCVRLLPDGRIDGAFMERIGTGSGNEVNCFATMPDQRIILGGWFETFNTSSANRIVRLNNTVSSNTVIERNRDVVVAPQPCTESCTIVLPRSMPTMIYQAMLYDMQGKLVHEWQLSVDALRVMRLSVSALPTGRYMLHLSNPLVNSVPLTTAIPIVVVR